MRCPEQCPEECHIRATIYDLWIGASCAFVARLCASPLLAKKSIFNPVGMLFFVNAKISELGLKGKARKSNGGFLFPNTKIKA